MPAPRGGRSPAVRQPAASADTRYPIPMTPTRSSTRATSGRRRLLDEVERLAQELRPGQHQRIEETLAALIGGEGRDYGISPDELFAGGVPRIRPVLVQLAAQSGVNAGPTPGTQDVAMVAELLHAAVILHDAALGRREGLRRRAARRVLHRAGHWLGGNHLTLRALEIARRAPAPEILGDALDALREVTEGQAFGASLQERTPTPADVLQHTESQAGAVLAFSCRAGGRLAGVSRPALTRLGRYGRHTGVAFQLAEDLAAFDSTEGLEALTRLAVSGRPVLAVAFAAERDEELARLWRELGDEEDDDVAARVAERVGATGAIGKGREAMLEHVWSARRALSELPETPARGAMDRIVGSLAG